MVIKSTCRLSHALLEILGCEVEYSEPGIPDKLYYSITEVSKIVDVAPHVIRYWEKHFPILSPGRGSSSNWRNYVMSDINALREIKSLVNDKGMTISGAKKMMAKGPRVSIKNELESLLSELEEVD